MSRHPKKEARHKSDFYATPPALVERMVRRALQVKTNVREVLEPGCASAPFLRSVKRLRPAARCVGIEYEGPPPGLEVEGKAGLELWFDTDFMVWAEGCTRRFDLIITNPPFSLAMPFLRSGISLLDGDGWLFYLLRLGWLEGKARKAELHDAHPPESVDVVVPRPSFTGGGTDATAYAMFGYKREPSGVTRLGWLP
jgi:hypothetical protein